MKKNTINIEYALKALKENYADYCRNGNPDDSTTLRGYIEGQADNFPGFFRWLFNNDDIEDFGTNLTDEQKEEYNKFLNR